jgi:hypothetical protein
MSNESTPYKPKTLAELLRWKQLNVVIYRDDVFAEEEDPEWSQKHKLGPVHIMIRCKLCDTILFRDLKEFGWLHNDSFYESKLVPHLEQHK